jgi:hypothetical protein
LFLPQQHLLSMAIIETPCGHEPEQQSPSMFKCGNIRGLLDDTDFQRDFAD